MQSLTDFLNHGLLPFVGRSHEIDTLMDFWRSSIDVGGLRLAIITGEAGSGKTRLLDQLLPRIAREGGMVVRARLYPDSTALIAPLMAQALGKSGIAFRLLKVAPEGTIADVVTTFRRVARLRPVVLMIEDLHLLQGEALQELGVLLHTLSDEDLTVLCATRTMELPVRHMLEDYSGLEMELRGLEQESLQRIWKTLFGTSSNDSDIETILNVTLGNPLAIRSALRGAISSGMITPSGISGEWLVAAGHEPFAHALQQGVRVLSEGLAAQLTESEREDGAQLACLGERFSREAAELMIDDAETVIERLLHKGLLVTTDMPSQPLAGIAPGNYPASDHPLLAFTHSLVHRQFVERAAIDPDRLLQVVGSDVPLYSTLTFELIANSEAESKLPVEAGMIAFRRSIEIIHLFDFNPNWEQSFIFLRTAQTIQRMFAGRLNAEQDKLLRAEIALTKFTIQRHIPFNPEHESLIAELFDLTAEPAPPALLPYRIRAWSGHTLLGGEKDPQLPWRTWEEVEEFIGRNPSLRYDASYLNYLYVVTHWGKVRRDQELLRMVERHVMGLIELEETPNLFRKAAQELLLQFFIGELTTKEEIERRKCMIAEIEASSGGRPRTSILGLKLEIFDALCETDEIEKVCRYLIPRTRFINPRAYFQASHILARAGAGQGANLARIRSESERLSAEAPDWFRPRFRYAAGQELLDVGVMAGEIAWARSILNEFFEKLAPLQPAIEIVLAMADNEAGIPPEPSGDDWEQEPVLRALVERIRSGEPPESATIEAARLLLNGPVLQSSNVLRLHALLPLLRAAGITDQLTAEIRRGIATALEWLAERKHFVFMKALVSQHEHYLGSREVKEWRRRIVEIEREISAQRKQEEPSQQVIVAMLGTIEVTLPQQEPVRPRGSRLRLFLGLLVADAIMKRQLSFQEMCAIVSTDASGERCRKALNEAVYRLRELLGHDAVITEEETPRLNRLLVEVDLIEAYDRLRGAATALVSGSLLQAHRSLLSALKLTRGEVPFPGLYEDFFEHAREEFDYLLRSTLIGVGRALLSEGDLESAEELLERGYESIPEDEEIAGLLSQTYERMGRKASAERVRAQAGMLSGGGDLGD